MGENESAGQPAPRERLTADVASVLDRLPTLGKVMVVTRLGGATHERIGPVEGVRIVGTNAYIDGAAHHAAIHLESLTGVIADRSMVMGGNVLPRLDFSDANGDTVFSVIALGGLEAFDAALAPLGSGEPLDAVERAPREQSTVGDDDLGAKLLDSISTNGAEVTIRLSRPGFEQSWTGVIAELKPGGGFVNVMTPDFHLHLRGGSVIRWEREEANGTVNFHAVSTSGMRTGLAINVAADVAPDAP